MLLSFPEYLGLDRNFDTFFGKFIGFLNVLLALPVFFYSSSDYFKSAFKSLKKKVFNIDVPLSLGIIVLFLRAFGKLLHKAVQGILTLSAGLSFSCL